MTKKTSEEGSEKKSQSKTIAEKKEALKKPPASSKAASKKKSRKGAKIVKLKPKAEGIIPHTGKEAAAELRQRVLRYKDEVDSARWNYAQALWEVKDEAAYANWGYPNFEKYIEVELNVKLRTVQYLTSMYEYFAFSLVGNLDDMSVSEKDKLNAYKRRNDIIEDVKKLGWTKAKCLVDVLTLENADKWIKKATELPLNELEAEAKKALNKKKGITDPVEVMKFVSFKLAEEQLEIVENAIELASGPAVSEKRGHLISLICQDFVATNMAQTDSGKTKYGSYFDKIGSMFGMRLIAVDKETGKVVHGVELFESMNKEK